MNFVMALLALAGAVALLLWGTHMVHTGVQRAFGPRLRHVLGRALRGRFVAFGAGALLTVILQSSTATGLMVTGFAAAGLVDLVPALAVMAGANLGTAFIVQALAFDIVWLSPLLILAGVVLFRRNPTATLHDLGRAIIGLGLMLLALHQMLELVRPISNSADLRLMLKILSDVPALALLLAAIAAWLVHSSIAIVLLIVTLASNGAVPLDAALVMVLGANLGTALNPILEGANRSDPVSMRLPVGNMLNRLAGVAVAVGFAGPAATLLSNLGLSAAAATAMFHVVFNLATALVALPALPVLSRLLRRMLPEPPAGANPAEPLYLDRSARAVPELALGGATREALRLVDTLEQMLVGARDALASTDRKLITAVRDLDDILDSLNRSINAYLTSFDPDDLGEADRARLQHLLTFSMNIEQAGDIVDRALLLHNLKRIRRGATLSPQDSEELRAQMDRLIANLRTAATLLMTSDPRTARLLAREKEVFRRAERDATDRHFACLRQSRPEAAEGSSITLDLLRDMKIVNSFIVAAGAYPVLDRAGELRSSRVASE